jgi:hypothetical protein
MFKLFVGGKYGMSIDQTDVIDSIGVDPAKNEAQLFIFDHLEWNTGEKSDKEHMYLLQEKINTYLRFIESGEIYEAYPKSREKALVIRLVGRYEMCESAVVFFEKIEDALAKAGHKIERLGLAGA